MSVFAWSVPSGQPESWQDAPLPCARESAGSRGGRQGGAWGSTSCPKRCWSAALTRVTQSLLSPARGCLWQPAPAELCFSCPAAPCPTRAGGRVPGHAPALALGSSGSAEGGRGTGGPGGPPTLPSQPAAPTRSRAGPASPPKYSRVARPLLAPALLGALPRRCSGLRGPGDPGSAPLAPPGRGLAAGGIVLPGSAAQAPAPFLRGVPRGGGAPGAASPPPRSRGHRAAGGAQPRGPARTGTGAPRARPPRRIPVSGRGARGRP